MFDQRSQLLAVVITNAATYSEMIDAIAVMDTDDLLAFELTPAHSFKPDWIEPRLRSAPALATWALTYCEDAQYLALLCSRPVHPMIREALAANPFLPPPARRHLRNQKSPSLVDRRNEFARILEAPALSRLIDRGAVASILSDLIEQGSTDCVDQFLLTGSGITWAVEDLAQYRLASPLAPYTYRLPTAVLDCASLPLVNYLEVIPAGDAANIMYKIVLMAAKYPLRTCLDASLAAFAVLNPEKPFHHCPHSNWLSPDGYDTVAASPTWAPALDLAELTSAQRRSLVRDTYKKEPHRVLELLDAVEDYPYVKELLSYLPPTLRFSPGEDVANLAAALWSLHTLEAHSLLLSRLEPSAMITLIKGDLTSSAHAIFPPLEFLPSMLYAAMQEDPDTMAKRLEDVFYADPGPPRTYLYLLLDRVPGLFWFIPLDSPEMFQDLGAYVYRRLGATGAPIMQAVDLFLAQPYASLDQLVTTLETLIKND